MSPLVKFIKIAMNRPYADPMQHEKRVGSWLFQSGFEDCSYQPFGENNPPDWEVTYNGKKVHIECKTSLVSNIHWNNTPPQKDTLYVFSSKKYNDTMLFFGSDVCDLRLRNYLKKEIDINKGIANQIPNRFGFTIYYRPIVVQRGPNINLFKVADQLTEKAKKRANSL
jgi:hypothetical protein